MRDTAHSNAKMARWSLAGIFPEKMLSPQNIPEKVRTSLCGFQHPRQYGDLILKPMRKINTDLIREEWDNLQRIFVSLALKTTTQSIIVSKLSAYARKNKTRRALWEYDAIMGVYTYPPRKVH